MQGQSTCSATEDRRKYRGQADVAGALSQNSIAWREKILECKLPSWLGH